MLSFVRSPLTGKMTEAKMSIESLLLWLDEVLEDAETELALEHSKLDKLPRDEFCDT